MTDFGHVNAELIYFVQRKQKKQQPKKNRQIHINIVFAWCIDAYDCAL